MKRHAEIAGGGIGGLGVGMMLARHGWSVRVHERSSEIREVGAGIYIKNNSMRVLEHYGVLESLLPHATRLEQARICAGDGRVMQRRTLSGPSRVIVLPRQALIDALARAATEAGVEIVTNSTILSGDPDGALVDSAGKRFKADLVIAADGNRSRVRDSLNIGAGIVELGTMIDRFLAPTRSFTQAPETVEYWNGRRRIGITPSGPDFSYVYMVAPRDDARGCTLPLDTEDWTRSHPVLSEEFEILSKLKTTQYPYALVTCPQWSKGRVAVIGDAAHGLPPTLGQGAGLTLMNSHALAEVVSEGTDVAQSLQKWEQTVRFISDATQRWSVRYDRFTREWPRALSFMRPAIVWSFGRFPALNQRMRIADFGLDLTPIKWSGQAQ